MGDTIWHTVNLTQVHILGVQSCCTDSEARESFHKARSTFLLVFFSRTQRDCSVSHWFGVWRASCHTLLVAARLGRSCLHVAGKSLRENPEIDSDRRGGEGSSFQAHALLTHFLYLATVFLVLPLQPRQTTEVCSKFEYSYIDHFLSPFETFCEICTLSTVSVKLHACRRNCVQTDTHLWYIFFAFVLCVRLCAIKLCFAPVNPMRA